MERQITDTMEAIRSELEGLFTNLYCKKDFEDQLSRAKKAAGSRRPYEIQTLVDMYKDIGVVCEKDRPLSYYEGLLSKVDLPESVKEVNDNL